MELYFYRYFYFYVKVFYKINLSDSIEFYLFSSSLVLSYIDMGYWYDMEWTTHIQNTTIKHIDI